MDVDGAKPQPQQVEGSVWGAAPVASASASASVTVYGEDGLEVTPVANVNKPKPKQKITKQ